MDDFFVRFVTFVIIMVVAIPLHEFGHALAADYSGDDIPALQGRLTVEPWAHWDAWGTLLIAMGLFSPPPLHGAVVGWGKPILSDPSHYRNGRWGRFLVATAGVMVNLVLALLGAVLFRVLHLGAHGADPVYQQICGDFVRINLTLAFFNLLPVPPLDGSKLLIWLLPGTAATRYEQGFMGKGMVLIFLLVFACGSVVAWPAIYASRLLLGPSGT